MPEREIRETWNRFGVGRTVDGSVSVALLRLCFTMEEAANLAAWLRLIVSIDDEANAYYERCWHDANY